MAIVHSRDDAQDVRRLFSRAAALLSASAGYRETLEHTLAACLPALGDFGFFDAREGDEVVRIVRAHDDEEAQARLRRTQWVPQVRTDMNLCALSSGEAALHADIDDDWYRRAARDERQLASMRTLGFRSMISVPMRARGELIGALTFFMGRSGRRHAQEHLALASDLAAFAAPVVANAALAERHQRAQAALLASQAQLRISYQAAGLGAWDWQVADNAVYWSPEYRDIYGLDPHERPTFERGMATVVPEDRPAVEAAMRQCLESSGEYRSEHRIRHPHRGLRWIHAIGRAEYDARKRPVRVSGMVIDVTERRDSERARAYLAAIVESSEDAIVSKTLDGIITSWNPGAQRLYGYSPAEIVGRPITAIIPPELHDEEAEILARVRRGERLDHYETVRVAKDGRRVPVSLMVSPVRDAAGNVIGISKIARDLTALEKANHELQALRDQVTGELDAMRDLQQVSSRLINRGDRLEDLLLEILDAGLRITGRTRGAIQLLDAEKGALRFVAQRGFTPDWTRFTEVRADDSVPSAIALRTGRRVVIGDITAHPEIARSPHLALFLESGVRSVQCTPLISRDGVLVGMFTTHGFAAELPSERDLRLLDILSRTAADLIERARAEAALKEEDRRKDEFLAILAHELRNPLAPIRYAVSIARDAASGEDARGQAVAVIERQVGHMGRLLDDLLDISRIARGTVALRKERVDIAACVNAATEAARPFVAQKRHRLAVELPGAPLHLDADPVRVTQIVTNLVTNAAKYTDAGGDIAVRIEREGAEAVIRVRDTGMGIPEELKPRLFELFAQADAAIARSEGGLGIGLALVRAFVALHGGTVEARSEGPGKGSEFVVRLPLAPAPASAMSSAGGETLRPATALRILVADDNEDICEMCTMLLRLWGHDALVARDGDEAIALLRSHRPDVALLDIGMPRLNGYEVGERARREPWGEGIMLVAVTGWGQDEARVRSTATGFDFHLTKPVDPAELERVLAVAAALRKSPRADAPACTQP